MKKITDYITKHYGAKDIEVIYAKGWKSPERSTINCPFETVLGKEIFMQWSSPSDNTDHSRIYWGYVKS